MAGARARVPLRRSTAATEQSERLTVGRRTRSTFTRSPSPTWVGRRARSEDADWLEEICGDPKLYAQEHHLLDPVWARGSEPITRSYQKESEWWDDDLLPCEIDYDGCE